jgi:hypothetical protein
VRKRVEHLVYWLNEECPSCRFLIDPAPGKADILWVFAQDPPTPERLARIEAAIAAAAPGTPVINGPGHYAFYHRPEAFDLLAAAGVPVPRSRFSDADVGKTLVILKPEGEHSVATGPVPYPGEQAGVRAFAFVGTADGKGDYGRYRAHFLLGEPFAGLHFFGPAPVLNWERATSADLGSSLTEEERAHIATIARISGLDFFAVDFLRDPDRNGAPVFTDINVYPNTEHPAYRGDYFGYWHELHIPALEYPQGGPRPSPWAHLDRALVALAGRSGL